MNTYQFIYIICQGNECHSVYDCILFSAQIWKIDTEKDGQKNSQLRLQASYFAGELHHCFFFFNLYHYCQVHEYIH